MQSVQATLNDLLGTPVFMLALLFFFWFLVSWIPPSRALRAFVLLVSGIVIVSTALAEFGIIWMGWTPPWQEVGISAPPASLFDLIVLPALTGLFLGGWLVTSFAGALPAEKRFQFRIGRAALLGMACLLYEIGMLWLGWPAPWHLPIPSE
jgi:hypothetical protein